VQKPTAIYALVCPLTGDIKYVGLTTLRLRHRLDLHISASKKSVSQPVGLWIAGLLSRGVEPCILLLESDVDPKQEAVWIRNFLDSGVDLLNVSAGGAKGPIGHKRPDDVRARMSKAQQGNRNRLGQPCSDEQKKKVSLALRGNRNGAGVRSDEFKLNLSTKLKGHTVSAETRSKISSSLVGRSTGPRSQASLDKIRGDNHWSRRKSFSEETKLKMSESAKRRFANPKERAKISQSVEKLWQDGAYANRKALPGEAVAPLPEGYVRNV
jgi:hypothetical protein